MAQKSEQMPPRGSTRISMQLRAGLDFPVTRIQNFVKRETKKRVGKDAGVMLAGIAETLVHEFLFESSMHTIKNKRKIIQPRDLLAALEGCEHLHVLKIRFSPILPGAGVIPPRFLDNLDPKSSANTTSLSPKTSSLTSGKNSKSVPGAPKKSPKVRPRLSEKSPKTPPRLSEKTPKTLPRLSEKSPTIIDDMDEEMEPPISPEAPEEPKDEEPQKWDGPSILDIKRPAPLPDPIPDPEPKPKKRKYKKKKFDPKLSPLYEATSSAENSPQQKN